MSITRTRHTLEYVLLNRDEQIAAEHWARQQHGAFDWFCECTGATLGGAVGFACEVLSGRRQLDSIGLGIAFGAIFARNMRVGHYLCLRLRTVHQEKVQRVLTQSAALQSSPPEEKAINQSERTP